MLIPHEFIYRGDLSAIGDFHSQCFVESLSDGDIVAVYFEATAVTNFTDSWYFGLKVDGVDVLIGTDRPQITSGDLQVEKTGLSIPVNFRDKLKPTIDARGTGTVNGPITVIIVVDDGISAGDPAPAIHAAVSKATPVDADELGIVDSAASNVLKKLTWANLKATLKTYLDTFYVGLTGAQTIAGVKTFSSSPIVPTPTNATDAANKTYVDGLVDGRSWKQSVRAATTAALTLASDFENGDTIDGVVLATGDRILIKNQASGSENGIYVVNASGAPTKASDADTSAEMLQATVYVREGTSNADKQYTCTNNSITLGTTALTFATTGAGGSGDMVSTNNLSDVASVSTARTNLGIGTGDSPQFTGLNVGHAFDTTVTRVSAGRIAVEGSNVIMASDLGTNVGTNLAKAADGSVVDAIGFLGIPQNSKSANYTTVMSDAGKEIFHPSSDANARTFTIDSNANVAYPIGTVIVFTNDSANNLTIAITADTLVLVGAGTTGSRTLAQYGQATARKVGSTRWYISGTNLT